MNKSNKVDESNLGHRLRSEAMNNSPDFSLSLHDRIMKAMKENRVVGEMATVRTIWRPMWWAVAAMILTAILAGRLWMQHTEQQEITRIQLSPNELQTAWLTSWDRLAEPIQQQLNEARFGYVDQDARRASQFLLSQLDILPSKGNEHRS